MLIETTTRADVGSTSGYGAAEEGIQRMGGDEVSCFDNYYYTIVVKTPSV